MAERTYDDRQIEAKLLTCTTCQRPFYCTVPRVPFYCALCRAKAEAGR